MPSADLDHKPTATDRVNPFLDLPIAVEVYPDRELVRFLTDLSPDTSWGDRQIAAQKLGQMRCQEALPVLLGALPADPFWMVRCAMIQALEMIGDPEAIPILQDVAKKDSFQIVRSYAVKAIERLSLVV